MLNITKCLAAALITTGMALAVPSTAQASIILTDGNLGSLDDDNVLLNSGVVGNPIFGALNTDQGNFSVRFTGNELLTAPAGGQARVTAAVGTFDYLKVDLVDASFTSLVLNIDASANGTVDFRGEDTDGNLFAFNNMSVGGSGQNYYTFTTLHGQRIAWIDFTADVPLTFVDAAQFRIGGAAFGTDVITPEPATMLLMATGVMAFAVRRRRRS